MPDYYDTDVESLVEAINGFVFPLRYWQGFQEERLQELSNAIRSCTTRWAKADDVPKMLAWNLAGLSYAVWQLAAMHDGEERLRIEAAAKHLHSLVNVCFKPLFEVMDRYPSFS